MALIKRLRNVVYHFKFLNSLKVSFPQNFNFNICNPIYLNFNSLRNRCKIEWVTFVLDDGVPGVPPGIIGVDGVPKK